jgi:hypothetical protein
MSPQIILSDLFNKFHSDVKSKISDLIIIEISIYQAFADIYIFLESIVKLKKLGYRVCIDGLNEASIGIVRREELNVDFGKISFVNSFSNISSPDILSSINYAIELFGKTKLIMSGCNDAKALSFGKSIDLTLFQGVECDKLIKKTYEYNI